MNVLGSPELRDGFRFDLYTLHIKTCRSDISDGRAHGLFQGEGGTVEVYLGDSGDRGQGPIVTTTIEPIRFFLRGISRQNKGEFMFLHDD
jgi:hypothetical protein